MEKLIKNCKRGKRKAQFELYEQLAPVMLGVCSRYAKDLSQAEEFLQEGFIRMFAKLDQYRFDGSFEGWVRRIMVTTSLELLRKEMRYDLTDDHQVFDGEQKEEILSGLASEDLMNLVQGLPPKYRAVFNLYAIEGYKHSEIADMLKISEGTSKSNLSDARKILKREVSKLYKMNHAG